jgi:hypothetical protein
MKLNEQNIKLSKCRNETCAKIRLSEKVSIPAASEMFVEGYVDGKLKVDFGLVEFHLSFYFPFNFQLGTVSCMYSSFRFCG